MAAWTIYHNPRCTKSRQTLELLREQGVEPEVIEYLKTPPDAATLRGIVKKLGIRPADLLRRKEPALRGMDLDLDDDDAVIDAMVQHPILIERPVVVKGAKAAIGRPPENVKALL